MGATQAEIKLVQLKNCFVNVPQSVVTVLDNAKAVSSEDIGNVFIVAYPVR